MEVTTPPKLNLLIINLNSHLQALLIVKIKN